MAEAPEPPNSPFGDLEPLLTTLARLFAMEGSAALVAILATSKASIKQTDYDNWDGGTNFYTLFLYTTPSLYSQLAEKLESFETLIADKAKPLLQQYRQDVLAAVSILPEMTTDSKWRDKAQAWLAGTGISNQGRVRTDNIAPRSCDGLLFRSQPEIHLYRALKALDISFAPLPVFIRGGEQYRRIEPDFVLLKDGILMVVEVDGDTVHEETPAEAHARTTMLLHEGAFIERVKASECGTPDTAKACAIKLVQILTKRKASK